MPEIKIIKKEIVIPVDRNENGYGDILFHDKAGKEYKIGNKRAHLGSEIIEGHAVELGYSNYTDKNHIDHIYIAEARLVESALPPPVKAHTPDEEGAAKLKAEVKPETPHTISGQEIGRCWNAIDALYIGGKLATLFGVENAEAILKFYRGVLASTLKLPIDGAKLPMWEKEKK
ncbi:MAG: hypothetical protein MUP81_02900 [Dehalococcoidia bacterium]|nr:hypothetical protein [Dehalococcoidia bacterium]